MFISNASKFTPLIKRVLGLVPKVVKRGKSWRCTFQMLLPTWRRDCFPQRLGLKLVMFHISAFRDPHSYRWSGSFSWLWLLCNLFWQNKWLFFMVPLLFETIVLHFRMLAGQTEWYFGKSEVLFLNHLNNIWIIKLCSNALDSSFSYAWFLLRDVERCWIGVFKRYRLL